MLSCVFSTEPNSLYDYLQHRVKLETVEIFNADSKPTSDKSYATDKKNVVYRATVCYRCTGLSCRTSLKLDGVHRATAQVVCLCL